MINEQPVVAGVIKVEETCRRIRSLVELLQRDDPALFHMVKLWDETVGLEREARELQTTVRNVFREHQRPPTKR